MPADELSRPVPSVLRCLRLDVISLDEELQPRAKLHRPTCEDYKQALVDGAVLPPVIVVFDGSLYWLTDGYHRLHAHKACGLVEIDAEVRPGTRQDALRLSLAANAEHGKRREPGDYRRAYELAVRHGLVDPTDTEGVRALIRCTGRWAEMLTKDARDAARAARDAAMLAERAAGKPVRLIAKDHGVGVATVDRALNGAPKTKPSQTEHGADPEVNDLAPPPLTEPPPTPVLPAGSVSRPRGRSARLRPVDNEQKQWNDWNWAVTFLAASRIDPTVLAARPSRRRDVLLSEASYALPRLRAWAAALEAALAQEEEVV